ncbi:MAG: GNAT family N-acetyltransferase [Ferruginibacter sp.]
MTSVKPALQEDIPIIRNLAEVIWPETYRDIISPEQLRYMLNLLYSEEALDEQIQNGHCFILAMHETVPIGFASFSKKSSEEPTVFRLHKLYVLPRQHGQGVGSSLLNYIYTESKNDGAGQLELNVNKYNPAKNFYEKKGFTVLRDEVIDIGEGYVMDDYVMGRSI